MNPNTFLKLSAAALVGAVIGAGVTFLLSRPEPAPPSPPAPVAAKPQIDYAPITFNELPGWRDDAVIEVLPALKRSCERLVGSVTDAASRLGSLTITTSERMNACSKVLAAAADPDAFRAALEAAFQPYAVSLSGNAQGTFTGYYEAALRGSLTRTGPYQTPLYGPPQNLVTVSLKDFIAANALDGTNVPATVVGRVVGRELKPYFTRNEIDNQNAIAADSDVVVWVDDAVDAHVLHIQGSGQVTLPDGTMMRVGFAGHNGHGFKGLGRILLDEGVLKADNASMGAVRDWLKANSKRASELMSRNARYIFFRKIDGDGPIGAEGVALTPGRSLAVDPRSVPLGLPLWLETTDPDGVPLRRLVMAQDVGAAITGTVRGDYFWGAGAPAFAKAARMKSPGRYYVLAPKALENPAKN